MSPNTGIVLDRSSGVPLHQQLAAALRESIATGALAAGDRVLSSRELEVHMGISRNTVTTAIELLQSEGYVVTVPRIGTFVAEKNPTRVEETETSSAETDVVPSEGAATFLSALTSWEPTEALVRAIGAVRPFRPGSPALDMFPAEQFRRCLYAAGWTPLLANYPANQLLKDSIAKRLQQTRGVVCSPDQVIVVGGAQAAFWLIGQVLLQPGDAVIVEDPGYLSARAAFLAAGARVMPVPVDGDGLNVRSFAQRQAALAYVTPSHQYPTGSLLTLERRYALLEWASKFGAWIVEDDYDSEFDYTGSPQPALQGLDVGKRVIYVGTFSKTISPGLRIGYLVIPRSLKSAFAAALKVTGGHPSPMLQGALAEFLSKGYYARHITKMRKIYDQRRRFVSSAFSNTLGLRVSGAGTGLHFVAELPPSIPDTEFAARAAEHRIIAPPLSRYFVGRPTANGLIIGFGNTPIAVARNAIETLQQVL